MKLIVAFASSMALRTPPSHPSLIPVHRQSTCGYRLNAAQCQDLHGRLGAAAARHDAVMTRHHLSSMLG